MGTAALVEQLMSARQQLDFACDLLAKPSPEALDSLFLGAGSGRTPIGGMAAHLLPAGWKRRRPRRSLAAEAQLRAHRATAPGRGRFSSQLAPTPRRHDRRLYRNRRIRPANARQPHLPTRVIVMSNLLASLVSSASTLEAYGRVLETVQNNVSNASTPGYAKQRLNLYALPFDPRAVSPAVCVPATWSARATSSPNRRCASRPAGSGYQQQLVDSLTAVQANFDISGNQGIPQALNNLFQSFSAWGATPDNQAARQTVVQRATDLAQSFQQAANNVSAQAHDAEQQIGQTVDQVNQLVGEIQGYNHIAMQGNKNDGGLSARMHAALEELATLVDVNATFQSDGTGEPDAQWRNTAPARGQAVHDQLVALPAAGAAAHQRQRPGQRADSGLGRQRHHRQNHRRPIGRSAPLAQPGTALVYRRRLPTRRSKRDGEAIRRSRQSALDLRQYHRRPSGSVPGVAALHLRHHQRHGHGGLAFGGPHRDAGPVGGDQSRPAQSVSNGVPLALSALASPSPRRRQSQRPQL